MLTIYTSSSIALYIHTSSSPYLHLSPYSFLPYLYFHPTLSLSSTHFTGCVDEESLYCCLLCPHSILHSRQRRSGSRIPVPSVSSNLFTHASASRLRFAFRHYFTHSLTHSRIILLLSLFVHSLSLLLLLTLTLTLSFIHSSLLFSSHHILISLSLSLSLSSVSPLHSMPSSLPTAVPSPTLTGHSALLDRSLKRQS